MSLVIFWSSFDHVQQRIRKGRTNDDACADGDAYEAADLTLSLILNSHWSLDRAKRADISVSCCKK